MRTLLLLSLVCLSAGWCADAPTFTDKDIGVGAKKTEPAERFDPAVALQAAETKRKEAVAAAEADFTKAAASIGERLAKLSPLPVPEVSSDPTESETARVQRIQYFNAALGEYQRTAQSRGAGDPNSISSLRNLVLKPGRNGQTPYETYLTETGQARR